MNTTKPITRSRTVWGLLLASILGLLAVFDIQITDSEIESVVQAVGVIAGFALGVYGRIRAKLPVRVVAPGGSCGMLLAICMLAACALQPACTTYDGLSPRSQQIIKATAKAALQVGLAELTQKNPEVGPYSGLLSSAINLTFDDADAADPVALATDLESAVDQIAPEHRGIILETFAVALEGSASTAPGTTQSGPQSNFNRALAAALR